MLKNPLSYLSSPMLWIKGILSTMKKYQHFIKTTLLCCLISYFSVHKLLAANTQLLPPDSSRKIRILAIDGGGVRGIIPARILQEIEEQTGKRIFELFDLVIGNSTGGLIALGLLTPDEQGEAKYKASDLVEFYRRQSPKIFSNNLLRKMITGWGLWAPKFNREHLDKTLRKAFGHVKLSQTLKNVLVLSYSLDKGEPHLWSSHQASQGIHPDYSLYDMAGATTAAPTYFAPKVLKTEKGSLLYEVDGAMWANNLEVLALLAIHSAGMSPIKNGNILLVSIGTGLYKPNGKNYSKEAYKLKDAGIIGWLLKSQPNLLDMMIGAESEWAKSIINSLSPTNYNIQVTIPKEFSNIDNSKHVPILKKLAEDHIKNNDSFKQLCKNLSELAQEQP